MAKKTSNFYGSQIKKGGLHRALGVPEGQKIPASKLEAAAHSKSGHMRKMANFAKNAKGFDHHMHHEVGKVIQSAAVLGGHADKIHPPLGEATSTTRWGIAHDGATSRGVHDGGLKQPMPKTMPDTSGSY